MFDPLKGRILPNVTSVALVNNTALIINTTVPAGKRWLLKFITFTNPDDVVRNVTVRLWTTAGKTVQIAKLGYKASVEVSSTQRYAIPSFIPTAIDPSQVNLAFPLLLSDGMTIEVEWAAGGASTGATDADGLVVYVVEYDL